jgi:hypothetical protein
MARRRGCRAIASRLAALSELIEVLVGPTTSGRNIVPPALTGGLVLCGLRV